jgi:hypothetical protein
MQECGELVLAIRQKEGFASTKLTDSSNAAATVGCSSPTNPGYGTLIVKIASQAGGTGGCPTGINCKLVTITLVKPDITLLLAE